MSYKQTTVESPLKNTSPKDFLLHHIPFKATFLQYKASFLQIHIKLNY